ncbi:MAG: lactate utilization protein [Bryobacterales bacterium]|nr:lactate utilization protein [Bryobacterales bacterium]
MDSREAILERVRAGLGRKLGQKPLPPPEPLLRIDTLGASGRLELFRRKLMGTLTVAADAAVAGRAVADLLNGREAVASGHPFLERCGIRSMARVFTDPAELRNACATAGVGITSAYCLLAETGTIVLRATPEEPRLPSLLPPVHIAVVPEERLLTNLDEMLSMTPRPVDDASAMVLISGPSRTGDIEQFLVRGVHGPGEIHVVIVQGKHRDS